MGQSEDIPKLDGGRAIKPVTRHYLESHAVKDPCHTTSMPCTSFSISSWMWNILRYIEPNTLCAYRETPSLVSRLGSGADDPAPAPTSSPGRVRGNAHLQKRESRGNAHLYPVLKFILTVIVAVSQCATVEARSATTLPPMPTIKTPQTSCLYSTNKNTHKTFFFFKGRMRRMYVLKNFMFILFLFGGMSTVGMMWRGRGGGHGTGESGTLTKGPYWDPAGNVPFHVWVQEVQVWLNAIHNRLTPTAQAAAIQLGLGGIARDYAVSLPPGAVSLGAVINGVRTDPVTFLLSQLANRFSELDDERTMSLGTSLLDFQRRPNEKIDALLT